MKPPDLRRCLKLGVSLAYFAMRSAFRCVLRFVGRPAKQKLTILCYHGVTPEGRARFARQMEALCRTACIVPATYHGVLRSRKTHVAITFDDALTSARDNAMPELSARSIHSTIFVPTSFLGRRPSWAAKDNERISEDFVMTVEQLKDLPANLVTFGSHGLTHVPLTQTQRETAWDEIENSRRELERLMGCEIKLFAFPYGDHDRSTTELCKMAGYEQAFTMLPDPVKTESIEMLRGRVRVDPGDWLIEFFLKVGGAYAWMTWWMKFKHSVLRSHQPGGLQCRGGAPPRRTLSN